MATTLERAVAIVRLLEDFVPCVTFYRLTLFDEIEDKMNEKTHSPRDGGNRHSPKALYIPSQIMNAVSDQYAIKL